MRIPIKKLCIYLLLMVFLLIPSSAVALVTSIDMNEFYSDGVAWTSSTGRLSVMFGESTLSNDPDFGDPGITVDSSALSLSFDYLFVEPCWQDVVFSAWLFDAEGNTVADFEATQTSKGHVDWELGGVFTESTILGLEFSLTGQGDLKNKAMAIICNPILVASDAVPVPEPAAMLLLGTGLLGIAGLSKKKIVR